MLLPLATRRGRKVPGAGPVDANILFVAEAPGRDEERCGLPMVGKSGQKQMSLWAELGLSRREIRIENVLEVRPPGNDLDSMPVAVLENAQRSLHRRMLGFKPNVIVACGNFALNTLRRNPIKKRREKGRDMLVYPDRIMSWRGSISTYTRDDGVVVKMIPTIHPSALLSAPAWQGMWEADWRRIKFDSGFPELRRLECHHEVFPTLKKIQEFYNFALELSQKQGVHPELPSMAIDIETPGRVISCIGFACTPYYSITIGLLPSHWPHKSDLPQVWQWVKKLCGLPISKATHGGLFDAYWMARYPDQPIYFHDWDWDTQAMHHCLDSSDRHSLAYCASRDLRVEYWKDEAKEEDGEYKGRYKRDTYELHVYNGKDACYTRALVPIYIQQLREAGLLDFYNEHYRRRLYPILDMMTYGMPVDGRKRELAYERERLKLDILRRELKEIAGEDLVAKKALSPKRVVKYFYETLGLKPPRAKRGQKGKLSAGEAQVRWLMVRNKKAQAGGQKILDFRRHQKLLGSFDEARVDDDGRFRSTYKFLTRWGRFASSKNPMGGGGNAQNIDREIRDMFIPLPGHVLLELDAAQGESRIRDAMAYSITKDPYMLWLATASPVEVDQHRLHAASILSVLRGEEVKPEAVTDMEREIGKRTNHAIGYGMGGEKMADQVITDSKGAVVLTADECQEFINALLSRLPSIPRWQEEIRYKVQHDRMLETSWGRRFHFTWDRLDDKTYKDAYSAIPQSELVDLVNQRGLIPLAENIESNKRETRILAQEHDSLVISSPPEEAWDVVALLDGMLCETREYWGTPLSMPIGLKVGMDWGPGMKKWKVVPQRDEFEAELARLVVENNLVPF